MRRPRLGLARSTHIKVLPAYGRQLSMTIRGLWLRLLLAPCARGQKNRPGQDDDDTSTQVTMVPPTPFHLKLR